MTQLRWNGAFVSELVQRTALDALKDGAEHVLTVTTPDVPLESGTLRRSGTVTVIRADGRKVVVAASYNTPYAVKQHEDLNLRHKVGGAKFLENHFNEEKGRVQDLVRTRVKGALDAGR